MAWTSVSDVTAGSVLTASAFNGQVLGNLTALRGDFDFHRRTAGNITLTGTTNWSDLTTIGTGADLTLNASAGDLVEASLFMLVDTAVVAMGFDVVTVVGSTKTNSLTSGGAAPAAFSTMTSSGWYVPANLVVGVTGSIFYVLQAGDISSNTVKLRVQYGMGSATNRLMYGSTTNPFMFYARNHGPVQS